MTRLFPASLALIFMILGACSSRAPEINTEDVQRIVSTLASDEMEGRRAYSAGIEKAARFIESELSVIGLEPLQNAQGFRQEFSAFHLTPTDVKLVLDGSEVPFANVFFLPSTDSLSWETGDAEISVVGPSDNLGAAFGRASRSPGDLLVIVDTTHESVFRQIQLFVSEGSRMLEMGTTGTAAFVLTDDVEVTTVEAAAAFRVDTLALTNLVAKIDGERADEIVLFSAHYDHLGIRPAVEGDSVANGANDNASGVTGVIELARQFEAMGKPERTLMFAFFTAEEMGGYGSHYFSEQLNPDHIVAMFNLEMIGKPPVSGPNSAWITGFDKSDFGEILQRAVEGTEYSFHPDPYPHQNLFYRSDNATLARKGVPAHTISTTPIDVDPDYHKVSDEVETLDFEHMTNTIRAVVAGARTIISGEATPTRVDLGSTAQ
ncbi:MAG TPA: M20/M25/M40 family metallo-hydrolase [Rhodothermales bacterium]|nr:M20/M25/M40 family metallo-hydrolase [Rhodothermales bacterium]